MQMGWTRRNHTTLHAFTFQVNEISHRFFESCIIFSPHKIAKQYTSKDNPKNEYLHIDLYRYNNHAEHMHISQRTADGFNLKGIDDPEDLFDFSV